MAPRALTLSTLLVALACTGGEGTGREGQEARAPAPADESSTALPATTSAETLALDDRTAAIREGIDDLPSAVGRDAADARQQAVALYIEHMERIEAAHAPRAGRDGALADAVLEAESRFHTLMDLLGTEPPPDSIAVARAVEALQAGLVTVERRAAEEGAP